MTRWTIKKSWPDIELIQGLLKHRENVRCGTTNNGVLELESDLYLGARIRST